ncbi:hypothetical protein [Methylobrevis albus]|uniref:Alpha/beta hydrolase family protein n=1 Tax=Methylobrevis albus TaxID=2793297 RepID=A0A931I3A7_9HYPH|nr:hypothetical protein [Methylobrevis albus]MBH0239460.1 hypothetical protein [Methylobrevis albus]
MTADAPPAGFECVAGGLAASFAPLLRAGPAAGAIGRGSGTLAVVFSQVRVPAGKFGLSRLFARTQHHGLFLNDLSGGWYRDQAAAIDAAIDAAAARLAPVLGAAPRTVYYGSSMGAQGALATALRRGDGAAIVFGPDLVVGAPGSQSGRAGLHPGAGDPDLLAALDAWSGPPLDLVFGLFDPADGATAARIAGLRPSPTRRLVPVASTHEVHDHLFSLNVVRRAIAGFSRPIADEVAAKGLLVPAPDWAALARLGEIAAAVHAGGAWPAPAAIDALGLGVHPGAALLAAEGAAAAGRPGAGADRLAATLAAIAADPALATLPKRAVKPLARRMIDLLLAAGRSDEARRHAVLWHEAHPDDDGFQALAASLR